MVDISLEILASSVPLRNGSQARHRIKTWWAHIDVPLNRTLIKLPRLPMIQQYLIMTGKDTTVYVETWQDANGADDPGETQTGGMGQSVFLGMTVCSVDEQLKNPNLNPSVQWLTVHDPIENIQKGKLLLKIDAKFALSENVSPKTDGEVDMHRARNQDNIAPHFQEFDNSPAKLSTVSSRKSDTSVFSVGSASSLRSNQSVQTDLSLPILPDISKFATALKQPSMAESSSKLSSSRIFQHRQQLRSYQSKSATAASASAVDPAEIADQFLIQRGLSLGNHRVKASQALGDSPNRISYTNSSNGVRKSCLMKQHLQHRSSGSTMQAFDVNSVDDVIDMLNDSVFSPPVTNQVDTKDTRRDSQVLSSSDMKRHSTNLSTNAVGAPKDFSIHTIKSNIHAEDRLAPEGISTFSNKQAGKSDADRDHKNVELPTGFSDDEHHHRFKEIHFDGVKARKEATDLLMSKTVQQQSQATTNPPPVFRRRIAAAIFND